MPEAHNSDDLYNRGKYRLAWDRKRDGSLRTPFLQIVWYDATAGRYRSKSTGSAVVEEAEDELDKFYLARERGQAICAHCGQPLRQGARHLVTSAIADYKLSREDKPEIGHRLTHVLDYLTETERTEAACEDLDDAWIAAFRAWAIRRPVLLPNERTRPRAASTVENSVRQLAAAINFAHARKDTMWPAAFKALPPRQVNRTPQHRSAIDELARMFAYCLDKSRRKRSAPLHRYLIASVATAARPDAVLDISLAPTRQQWNSGRRVLNLSPRGRQQTKKVRAIVRAPWQLAAWLDAEAEKAKPGFFVPAASVKHAWASMAEKLGLPGEGESGMKLIRRSMAQLIRDAGTERGWSPEWRDPARKVHKDDLELQLGHRVLDPVTDLYAAFDPAYLGAR